MLEGDRKTESRIAIDDHAWPRWSLLVVGARGGFTFPLPPGGAVSVGRDERCQVAIVDPELSREHARVLVGDAVEIVDLGSLNGTRVRGTPLTAHEAVTLGPGDVVSLGSTVLVLQRASAEEGPRQLPSHERVAPSGRSARVDPSSPSIPVSGALERLRPIVERLAVGTIPVLVLGETGAGKDVVAAMIHRLSPRASHPYVCLNCAALPESLFENELFGHERGAFTGAHTARPGLLETARGGTVFFDEVAEMPLGMQAKLLRVLDHGEVRRLGASDVRPIDVRFIVATNRDLESEVERGGFRRDLFFRLAAAAIVVPPLRERVAEIAPLAAIFVAQAARDLGRTRVPRILPEAIARLEGHTWPGNVRELRNAIARAVLLCGDGDIGIAQLPRAPAVTMASQPRNAGGEAPQIATPLHATTRIAEVIARDPEAARIVAALEGCGWSQSKAAEALGVSRRTLVSRLTGYGLTRRR